MFDAPQTTSLGNISRPASGVLTCETPKQIRISGQSDGTRSKYVKTRCGTCWRCVKTKENELLGRYLAECATAKRVELWSLSYHGKTPESLLGSKQRCVDHWQKFQKVIRQREKRGLTTYNRREKKAAALEQRAPKLVDLSRSYCTFHPVFEFGTKNGRGHWHVVIVWHSHFPISEENLRTQSPEIIPPTAVRVWDLKSIVGPETPHLPDGANDGDVIDWRCRQLDHSQAHSSWPHGFVNIQCASHDMQAVDYYKRSAPARRANSELVGALRYTLKYLAKPDTDKNGNPLSPDELLAQDETLKRAKGGSRLYRTGSRSMGTTYAREVGKRIANYGVPLNHVHFQVDGVTNSRSRVSLAKFEAKLRAASSNEQYVQQHLINAHRVIFQMHGAMRDACVDAYLEIALAKGIPEAALGDVGLARLRQLAAADANEKLRSDEMQFRRRTSSEIGRIYGAMMEYNRSKLSSCAREMLDQGVDYRSQLHRLSLPLRILAPEPFEGFVMSEQDVPSAKWLERHGATRRTELEKLNATREAIAFVDEIYRAVPVDGFKYQEEKRGASSVPDLAHAFLNRSDRHARPNQDAVTQKIYEQTLREVIHGYQEGENPFECIELAETYVQGKLAEPEEKPWGCLGDGIPASLRLLWLNYSDAYGFPEQRERHIQRYCCVREIKTGYRLVITPDGRLLVGTFRKVKKPGQTVLREKRMVVEALEPRVLDKWIHREITCLPELYAALEGNLPTTGLGCPVFDPDLPQPFKNTWAMEADGSQKLVLQFERKVETHAELNGPQLPYRVRNRVDRDGPQFRCAAPQLVPAPTKRKARPNRALALWREGLRLLRSGGLENPYS